MIWAWMLWEPYALGTRTNYDLGMDALGTVSLWEHERNYDLGMDALGTVRTAGANCLTCCMRVRSYPGKVVRQAVS